MCDKKEEFVFAAIGLAHGHIYAMCDGLIRAGGRLKYVSEENAGLLSGFLRKYRDVTVTDEAAILSDSEVRLVATADIPVRRADLGVRVMRAGKDFFTDKAASVGHDQLDRLEKAINETGRRFFVFYSERVASPAAVCAKELIDKGAIGKVVNVTVLAPHKLGSGRPEWFFTREDTGGILIDIGSHQFEQFLTYTGNERAEIISATVANHANPGHPGFDDFGDCYIRGENGATGYIRVDWYTPASLPAFGDGKVVILGTEGYIELRKYVDVGSNEREVVIFSDKEKTERFTALGKYRPDFFDNIIYDCKNGTERAMSISHALYTMRLAVDAQLVALGNKQE